MQRQVPKLCIGKNVKNIKANTPQVCNDDYFNVSIYKKKMTLNFWEKYYFECFLSATEVRWQDRYFLKVRFVHSTTGNNGVLFTSIWGNINQYQKPANQFLCDNYQMTKRNKLMSIYIFYARIIPIIMHKSTNSRKCETTAKNCVVNLGITAVDVVTTLSQVKIWHCFLSYLHYIFYF